MLKKIEALEDQLWLLKADAAREEGFASTDDVSAFLADLRKPAAEIGNNKASYKTGTITYKDYAARIEYSDEDACFVGHIAGICDVVGFHCDSAAELKTAFESAVDDYLAMSEKLGRPSQKPYSGKLMLRIPPEILI